MYVGAKDNYDDTFGRQWWMEKRQSLNNEDIKNLHMYDVEVGSTDR